MRKTKTIRGYFLQALMPYGRGKQTPIKFYMAYFPKEKKAFLLDSIYIGEKEIPIKLVSGGYKVQIHF